MRIWWSCFSWMDWNWLAKKTFLMFVTSLCVLSGKGRQKDLPTRSRCTTCLIGRNLWGPKVPQFAFSMFVEFFERGSKFQSWRNKKMKKKNNFFHTPKHQHYLIINEVLSIPSGALFTQLNFQAQIFNIFKECDIRNCEFDHFIYSWEPVIRQSLLIYFYFLFHKLKSRTFKNIKKCQMIHFFSAASFLIIAGVMGWG